MVPSARGGEALNRFLGVRKNLAASDRPVPNVPDPGDRDIADPEGAAACVDPSPHQQRAAATLDHLRRDQQLVPSSLNVAQVVLQAGGADVWPAAADLLRRADREELHPFVAELDDLR